MAKSDVLGGELSAISLSDGEKRFVVAAIEVQLQQVKRAKNAEKDLEIAQLRQAQYDRLAALQQRFR